MGAPIGYVVTNFPQLSETFIENEIRALRTLGDEVAVFSLYRPTDDVRGRTHLDEDRLSYRPGFLAVSGHFARWTVRHPVVTARSVGVAIANRSQTMLRAAWCAGWIATGLERAGARHVHAHFALDAACAGRAASDLLGLPFTFTLHAHELYLRNRTLCRRVWMADVLVTVCRYNVRELEERCAAIPTDRLEIVYCGVDPGQFRPVEPLAQGGPLRLVSVGRLVPQKGFDDLIRAIALLRARDCVVECNIIGSGRLGDELQTLIDRLGVHDNVRLVGARTPDEVARALQTSDVFVLACKIDEEGNRDSMPVVVKEAMASGLPVVATDEVAIPEMVDDDVGRLVPPGDPEALAAAIGELAAMGEAERARLGRAGRRRVEANFNLFVETAKLQAIFNRLGERLAADRLQQR